MPIISLGRRPKRLRGLPSVRAVMPQRDWFSTRQAAAMLGLSEPTLRRRTARRSWVEGVHYRWITRHSRRTLEINVSQAIQLMNAIGWG